MKLREEIKQFLCSRIPIQNLHMQNVFPVIFNLKLGENRIKFFLIIGI